MAEGVYRIVDVVGVSEKSWEDAGRNAVETAAGSLRDLRIAEVVKLDMKVENGKVGHAGRLMVPGRPTKPIIRIAGFCGEWDIWLEVRELGSVSHSAGCAGRVFGRSVIY